MGEVTKKSELPLYMELQNWFKSQTTYRTKKELAEDIGIKEKDNEFRKSIDKEIYKELNLRKKARVSVL